MFIEEGLQLPTPNQCGEKMQYILRFSKINSIRQELGGCDVPRDNMAAI